MNLKGENEFYILESPIFNTSITFEERIRLFLKIYFEILVYRFCVIFFERFVVETRRVSYQDKGLDVIFYVSFMFKNKILSF